MLIKIIEMGKTSFEKEKRDFRSKKEIDIEKYESTVRKILKNVRLLGDKALVDYTKQFDFDAMTIDKLLVDQIEVNEEIQTVSSDLIKVYEKAYQRIYRFHEMQKADSWHFEEKKGIKLGQKISPIEKVGIYVPGGRAVYPSSVIMNVVPAKVAGVENIFMVTPPGPDGKISPYTLAAAKISGVQKIFRVGGAQAIAALAFGTESIPQVDKITGPGNVYVALAKKEVFGTVDIDMIAGPSEVVIIADESADPSFVAADLMSQAEHDPMAMSILITNSNILAEQVNQEIQKQIKSFPTKATIEASLLNNGRIYYMDSLKACIEFANFIAPEHLELSVKKPEEMLEEIKHAGAVFLGHYSPEPLGDYMAGPNHVLPTGGTAKFFSPLSVDDFIKKTSIIEFDLDSLNEYSDDIIRFAQSEGLYAHANSISVRFK